MNDQWPPSGQQQPPHQPYPQQPYGQYSFPPEDERQRPMPQDVGTASQLWWVVAALGLLQLFVVLPVIWGDKDTYIDELMNDPSVAELEGEFTRETAETILLVGFGVTVVLALILTAVFVLFVHFMRKGRNWARHVLTFVGVFLAVQAIPVLFGIGTGDGGLGMVLYGGVQILQAVTIVGAIVLMHRRESSNYFLKVPLPPNDTPGA